MATKRTYTGTGGEDSAALVSAYNEGMREYASGLGTLRATDMIMALGGDKSALARNLAGISEAGALPRRGTAERTRYDSQMRSIDRWLAYERGDRGKQTRNVERSKATQARFRDLYLRRNPPRGRVQASISGWIGYDGQWRYRSIEIPPPAGGRGDIDTDALNAAMAAGNTSAAYEILFNAYAPGLTVAEASSFEIHFERE